MPLVYKKEGDDFRLGLWKIEEDIPFFESAITYRSNAANQERAKQQLAARMALESVHANFPFNQVEIIDGGKPALKNNESKFSLSHCNGYSAAIISQRCEVGIDIEPIHERVIKVEKKFLNDHELNLLASAGEVDRVVYSTLFWSLKESMYKWWGKGSVDFSSDIQIIEFNKEDEGTAAMKFTKLPDTLFKLNYIRFENIWMSLLCK
jgi:4'-phosphopantetheinyl transferase